MSVAKINCYTPLWVSDDPNSTAKLRHLTLNESVLVLDHGVEGLIRVLTAKGEVGFVFDFRLDILP